MNAPVAATEDLIYSVEDGIARLLKIGPNALKQTVHAKLSSSRGIHLDNAVSEQEKKIVRDKDGSGCFELRVRKDT